MFSGKDAANPAYPTQWALNPTAYQNVDCNSVDWASLAQQWIAMKEAAAILDVPAGKPDNVEEGEAPMEVENPDSIAEPLPPAGAEWNATTNSWGGTWSQWGWGWDATGLDPKAGDPTMAMTPEVDGYAVPNDGTTAAMPGYTTGPAPTFQHGYWTAPQPDPASNRSSSSSQDRKSKREYKPRSRRGGLSNRDKPPLLPHVMDPLVMSSPGVPTPVIDAAKRRQLPAWIREGLEKMEREKQRAIEREEEKRAREEAEKEKKRLEEEELERMKAVAGGQPMIPAKSKFDSDSGEEDQEKDSEIQERPAFKRESSPERSPVKREPSPKRTAEEIMQEVMLTVRRSLTEILLEVTDQEIHTVSQEELARFNVVQASRLNAMKASKSKALASIATGLGLGAYESSSEESGSEDEKDELTDYQLQEVIRRKKNEFERTSREIEAEVARAEREEQRVLEGGTPRSSPLITRDGSSTPPPVVRETPEKHIDNKPKEWRNNNKSHDRVDGHRKLDTISEEKSKKPKKREHTPTPPRHKSHKETSSSTSSDSEKDSSSSSSESSDENHSDAKKETKKVKKHKRRSSSESYKKSKKNKSKSDEKSKKRDDYDKVKSKKKKDDRERHKSSRSRDYERSHKDKYRDDSVERAKKKRSRSGSYESRGSERRRRRDRSYDKGRDHRDRSHDRGRDHRDRSYEKGRDRDRSHDRGRDRSHDRGRDYDRYERSRDDRRRSRSSSRSRHRR